MTINDHKLREAINSKLHRSQMIINDFYEPNIN